MVNWWFGILGLPLRIPIPLKNGDRFGIQTTNEPLAERLKVKILVNNPISQWLFLVPPKGGR